jgi:hypothetical protein
MKPEDRIEELEKQLENYTKNWNCECGGWSEPEMKHCQFCGGLRKDTWYAKRIEELEAKDAVRHKESQMSKCNWFNELQAAARQYPHLAWAIDRMLAEYSSAQQWKSVAESLSSGCAKQQDRIEELEATIERVRVFATSHIHLENGAVFVKVRRNMFLAAIKGDGDGF